ncbi:ABC transporter substrate-binding protein [Sporomusa sp.]|uniref:ABC transporter substrate-binding protein n=1 Tax=Sporomusa sp. TaxID=2078658 RepID=UPI002CA31676|nr:ABC transporter substrate-binding protein [Sporomusa sp.]HWR05833.1 ABC transporter substrate-binding protein [Sporomusa sp.]
MKKLSYLMVLVLLVMVLGGCGSSKPAEQATKKVPNDVLVVGMSLDLATLDPAATMDNASWKITYPCYDRLVKYKADNGKSSTEVEPMAAESWSVSPDGKEWIFKLRKNIKFHDGSPLTAQAVKFSFDRVMKIKKGPADYFPTLKAVEAVDDYTVKFVMEKPFPPFLYTLATNAASIINPKVMAQEKNGDLASGYLADHTMGSGAYELKEWNPGQNIKLQAANDYWGGAPALKTVLIQFIKDPSAQRLQLENGDIDIAESIPTEQLDQLKAKPDLQIAESPSLLVSYVYLNNKKAPLDNVKVRQALNYAIDHNAIIQGAIKGKGIQLKGPIPEGLWGYDPNAKGYSLNIEKGKQLLAEAGFAQGLTLKLLYSDYKSFWESEALLLQDNLAKIGVKVELEKIAWATLRDKVDRADYDLCLGAWSPDYADPQTFMTYWYDSRMFGLAGNRAFYKNDAVDALLREAEQISDQGARTKLYQQAQAIVLEEAPYILLFQSNSMVAMRKNVQGYVYNPMLESMYNFESMKKN